jgi:DNA-binding NarL/FixJ family response regulator
MKKLQILIADDHVAVRQSIHSLLESHPGWSVCAAVSNGREAVEQAGQLAPDVILLDLSMPELNGLQATREIVKKNGNAQVLILTMHESDDVAAEAARFGAKGVIDKSAAHDTLIPTIESLIKTLIHLADTLVGPSHHIGAFFHSPEERYRVLGPFVAEGLSRGERAIHLIDPPDRDFHIEALRKWDVDLARAEADGSARLIAWRDAYLRDDRFDQNAMLVLLPQLLADSSADGFPRSRLIAHMEWALSEHPGVEDLVEYESRLNHSLASIDDVVICAYDLAKFGSETIVDVMRTHPSLLLGDTLRDNPFYLPPNR